MGVGQVHDEVVPGAAHHVLVPQWERAVHPVREVEWRERRRDSLFGRPFLRRSTRRLWDRSVRIVTRTPQVNSVLAKNKAAQLRGRVHLPPPPPPMGYSPAERLKNHFVAWSQQMHSVLAKNKVASFWDGFGWEGVGGNRCGEKHSNTTAHHPVVKPPAAASTAV